MAVVQTHVHLCTLCACIVAASGIAAGLVGVVAIAVIFAMVAYTRQHGIQCGPISIVVSSCGARSVRVESLPSVPGTRDRRVVALLAFHKQGISRHPQRYPLTVTMRKTQPSVLRRCLRTAMTTRTWA